MFFQARADAFLLGIDNDGDQHGGAPGMIQHARSILAGRDFALLVYDSQKLDSLPGAFDLVHVDGDHSYAGTQHDLRLAWSAGGAILVDDYFSIPAVRAAVDDFLQDRPARLTAVDDKQVLVVRDCRPEHAAERRCPRPLDHIV
jgi:hypothetical protein